MQRTWLRVRMRSALLMLGLVMAGALPAQQLTTLYSFCTKSGGNCPDGDNVYAGLIQGLDGNLYGATYQGGVYGNGTIFKISRSGSLTTLYNFCAVSGCPHGRALYSGLTLAPNGNFYGVTQGGGTNGLGTVFTITPAGVLTTMYSFCFPNSCPDGGYPYGGLFLATDGAFYGTTYVGGAATSGQEGTIFKITPTGAVTALYSFCPQATECQDGSAAMGGLVQADDGDFYGTSSAGGAHMNWDKGLGNYGTVFKITAAGRFTTLYSFGTATGFTDGAGPRAGLVQASDGNFYGTTYLAGAHGNYGTIFKITAGGNLTTLYSFCAASGCADGANPTAPLIQATDGNLYGTTYFGGANNGGTIFRITPEGAFTTLYSFCAQAGCADGQYPYAGLFQATDGNLYGTTYQGGAAGGGAIFRLSLGAGPFVRLLPASAKVGDEVKILGTNLTGATGVSFNGVPAAFRVVSASEITATVPRDAVSGTVKVKLPDGTLSNNVAFQLLP